MARAASWLNLGIMRLLRFAPIVFEFFGTLLVWLDTVRLNARNPPQGFSIGDSPKYRAWYYHMGLYGFGLLFIGILLQSLHLICSE
jgi:hypothetical protein